eukprot:2040993-Rhodomonas_salina.1
MRYARRWSVQWYSASESRRYHAAMILRLCYPFSGTDAGYAATRSPVLTQGMMLRVCYAISGTGMGYAATRSPVLTKAMLLRDLRLCSYAISGTDIRYAPAQIEALHLKIQMMEAEGKGGSKGGDKKLAAHLETLQAEYDRFGTCKAEARCPARGSSGQLLPVLIYPVSLRNLPGFGTQLPGCGTEFWVPMRDWERYKKDSEEAMSKYMEEVSRPYCDNVWCAMCAVLS